MVRKNAFYLPALFLGGASLSHYFASKELDEIEKEAKKTIWGFSTGLVIGLVVGICIGTNYHYIFNKIFSIFDYFVRDSEEKSD
ncbi:succinate dehydrogenase subunit 3, putative [Plasmodium gallinaceum]|uniref:Succinate dehydrogenase subunit 3, putative n=1 Tax=Plasmodium gallinaceum TaxID=5849 RepID=A0A1J1GRN0_PLAGA|nr:succinate dehydrogenase subunit 3, putative [Plasmodium gallinaceum]CRG93690.1 succinate dehydrogenase subunit 3, putative [Plasmodium gallinaceum]